MAITSGFDPENGGSIPPRLFCKKGELVGDSNLSEAVT